MKKTKGYRPFKDIKNLYRGKLSNRRPPSPSISPEEDLKLFYEAMADVREIKEFRSLSYVKSTPRITRPLSQKDRTIEQLKELIEGKRPLEISKTQEYVHWKVPARTMATVEALHRGEYSVQDFIDLHGYTVKEAKGLLEDFLKSSIKRGFRCVKVIHGRGLSSPRGPVLKEAVLGWLEREMRRYVLAYATASPRDGGLGATYVLLRSKI